MTIVRFNARTPARPGTLDLALPPAPARQPLGSAADGYGQGLAAALQGIQRSPPRTMPALGDDLLAEALVRYAQRNSAEGQAAAAAAAAGQGGGGYGAPPQGVGDPASNIPGADAGAWSAPAGAATAPISSLNLNRASPEWTRYLQSIAPQLGGAGRAP
jgi:hypothetical protein